MKYRKILVTGGAGFIGSFLVDRLIELNYKVRILDNLEGQVHNNKIPSYLNKQAEFIKGDVRDYVTLVKAVKDVDAVFHLAALVGVSQSNYKIKEYIDVNIGGAGNLLDILVNHKNNVKKIITVSSMTGYGEGNYFCSKCKIVRPSIRTINQLAKKDWHMYCPNCQAKVEPIATDEKSLDFPSSIYATSKKVQQDIFLLIGSLYKIPTVVLRLFNVYGPRQSLSNPYTGVTAIFISRLKNNQPAILFEDGLQSRDFVSVHDVVFALEKSLISDKANYRTFNIGSGKAVSVKEIARKLCLLLKKAESISIVNKFRKNDIRHCFADITKARKLLGWKPKVSLEEGLKELIEWSATQQAEDKFSQAQKELQEKKLI